MLKSLRPSWVYPIGTLLNGKFPQYINQVFLDRLVVFDGFRERYINHFIVFYAYHHITLSFHDGVDCGSTQSAGKDTVVCRRTAATLDHVSVYRVNKTRDFTVMGNTHLRDKNLSLKAVGLLSKMLSFNDGWQFSTRGLATLCKEGPDAILSALKELEENGYLVRHRGRDDKGRMVSTEFDIYEMPQADLPHRDLSLIHI